MRRRSRKTVEHFGTVGKSFSFRGLKGEIKVGRGGNGFTIALIIRGKWCLSGVERCKDDRNW